MKANRMVVVLWAGGVRASESLADPSYRYIPRIGKQLVPQGAVLTSLYNEGWTGHDPALQAFASGRWEVHKYQSASPRGDRTFVAAARRAGRSVRVIGPSRYRLLLLSGGDEECCVSVGLSGSPAPFEAGDPSAELYPLKSYDRPVVCSFLKMKSEWPDLSVLYFEDSDMAHEGRWSWYTGAIRQSDELAWRVWRGIESEGRTNFVVLSVLGRCEHGETRWGFAGHSRDDEGCQRLWMVGLGPDFRRGRALSERARLIDVAPTVAHLLGVPFSSRGRVLTELLA